MRFFPKTLKKPFSWKLFFLTLQKAWIVKTCMCDVQLQCLNMKSFQILILWLCHFLIFFRYLYFIADFISFFEDTRQTGKSNCCVKWRKTYYDCLNWSFHVWFALKQTAGSRKIFIVFSRYWQADKYYEDNQAN